MVKCIRNSVSIYLSISNNSQNYVLNKKLDSSSTYPFKKIEVLAYYIAYHLNVNFSVLLTGFG